MFWLRGFIFFLTFTLNVQIKAKAQILEEPKNCWKAEGECAVKGFSSSGTLEISGGIVDYSKEAILVRRDENTIRLVDGVFILRSSDALKVLTKYATLQLKKDQAVIVELAFDQVNITAFSGDVVVYDLKENPYYIPQAYTNSFAKLNSKNVAEVGFARAANFKKVIQLVGEISSLDKVSIYKSLKSFRESWLRAIQETQDRSIASSQKVIRDEEERQRQQAERLRLEKIEREKIRNFFFKKTFLE